MQRIDFINKIKKALRKSPVVALLGPRQCGKTTLAQEVFNKTKEAKANYFDCENPRDLVRLSDPMLTLEDMNGLIVIDEIQRCPELFTVLRVLVDNKKIKRQFLILGSASRELIAQSSETLAGRIHYIELSPLNLKETDQTQKLWLRGGFPLAYLARTNQDSMAWRENYIKTYLEQDIPALGIQIPALHLRRFWMMLSHYHGNIYNASEIANSMDISHHTAKRYLDVLTGTFMVRQLPPWHENIGKRQVKSSKIYFRDSGIYHALLGIASMSDLKLNPKLGASWEGYALEQVILAMHADANECFFWSIHSGPELDLMIVKGGKRHGFEFKYSAAPKLTHSMQRAREQLKLDTLKVIYPGDVSFKLTRNIDCVGLDEFIGSI